MIPKDWHSSKIGKIAEPITSGSRGWAAYYSAAGSPFIRITNLRRTSILPDYGPIKYVALPEGSNEGRRTELRQGDILVSITADLGVIGYIEEQPKTPSYISQHVARVRIKCGAADARFVAYQLAAPRHARIIERLNDSGAKAGLNLPTIASIPVLLPSLTEQKSIAEKLRTWDRAIETVEALIANARAQKQALMQQLLPQGTTPPKKRLPDFSVDWQEVCLGDLVKEVSRNVEWNDDATYKLISVRRRSEGIFHRESLSGHDILTKSMKVARAGDFLISKMQILHGASALVEADYDGFNISGSYVALVPRDPTKLDIEFFNWYSRTPYFYKLTYISSSGVHIEKMTFNLKSFLKKTILVPSVKAEQSAIVERLNSANGLIEKYQVQAAALRQEKAALMQQLLTGKRRVKITESEDV